MIKTNLGKSGKTSKISKDVGKTRFIGNALRANVTNGEAFGDNSQKTNFAHISK